MKYQLLLLLWTLTAFCNCEGTETNVIKVDETANGIKLSCGNENVTLSNSENPSQKEFDLAYKDNNTGEYKCATSDSKIFVKFRTCDNCIELDEASIAGLVVGDVVATVAVGVAVYLIASKARTSPNPTTTKKRSNPHTQVNPEQRNRPNNDHYQPLRPRQSQGRDEYDVLKK